MSEEIIIFWDDPLRIKKKEGRKNAEQKARAYEKRHPELIIGKKTQITTETDVKGKSLGTDGVMEYFERKFTIKKKGLRCVYNPKEDFQFTECESCSIFPCYRDNLWQFNGLCMDHKKQKKEEKKCIKNS